MVGAGKYAARMNTQTNMTNPIPSSTEPSSQFSENWFEHNIPHWEQWIGAFRGKSGLRALEIGSFEGRSTLWPCENILTADESRIDCVDLFANDPVYED
jgi:hypothetical protein